MTGCGETSDDTEDTPGSTAGSPGIEQSLMAHEWLLDAQDSSLSDMGTAPVTLSIDENLAAGTVPCNTYRGSIELSGGDGIRFGELATTNRACEPAVMAAEQAYLDALGKVRTADVTEGDRLVLSGGDVRLAFAAYDAGDHMTGEWEVVNLRMGDAVTGPVEGTTPTVTFEEGGVIVTTGCNNLSAGWSLDGSKITFEPPMQTNMACDEPAGVMDQEAALGAALDDAASVEVNPQRLTILDDEGSILILATSK